MERDQESRLRITLYITLFILAVEGAGGFISGSLALISDAGHVLTDAFALGLGLLAAHVSTRPLDYRATYGYRRVGILAAVINGLSLLVVAVYIFYESYQRLVSPREINLAVMLPIAAFGLAANLVMASILGHEHKDLNIKSVWLHVIGDTLSSLGVIVAGVVIYFTGWIYADPLAGGVIGLIIVAGGARVVWDALHVMLDLVPRGYDIEAIAKDIKDVRGVLGVHNIHLRSLVHGRVSFTGHIWVKDQLLSEAERIRKDIESRLKEKGISHIVLQFENNKCATEGIYCTICGDGEKIDIHDHPH